MRKLLAVVCFLMLQLTAAQAVHVKGYFRKNGTYVRPYERSGPSRSSTYTPPKVRSYRRSTYAPPTVKNPVSPASSASTSGAVSRQFIPQPEGDEDSPEYQTTPMPYSEYLKLQEQDQTNGVAKAATAFVLPSAVKPSLELELTTNRLEAVEVALSEYCDANSGQYPAKLRLLIRHVGRSVPSVDGWLTPFHYETNDCGYALISCGPDRKFGTEDDIRSSGSGLKQ